MRTPTLPRGQETSAETHQHVRTRLHEVASQGHESEVSALLAAGASVDAADENGWTALHHAAAGGHTAVASALLEDYQVDRFYFRE